MDTIKRQQQSCTPPPEGEDYRTQHKMKVTAPASPHSNSPQSSNPILRSLIVAVVVFSVISCAYIFSGGLSQSKPRRKPTRRELLGNSILDIDSVDNHSVSNLREMRHSHRHRSKVNQSPPFISPWNKTTDSSTTTEIPQTVPTTTASLTTLVDTNSANAPPTNVSTVHDSTASNGIPSIDEPTSSTATSDLSTLAPRPPLLVTNSTSTVLLSPLSSLSVPPPPPLSTTAPQPTTTSSPPTTAGVSTKPPSSPPISSTVYPSFLPYLAEAPFPRWRFLTDRSEGITNDIALGDEANCADVLSQQAQLFFSSHSSYSSTMRSGTQNSTETKTTHAQSVYNCNWSPSPPIAFGGSKWPAYTSEVTSFLSNTVGIQINSNNSIAQIEAALSALENYKTMMTTKNNNNTLPTVIGGFTTAQLSALHDFLYDTHVPYQISLPLNASEFVSAVTSVYRVDVPRDLPGKFKSWMQHGRLHWFEVKTRARDVMEETLKHKYGWQPGKQLDPLVFLKNLSVPFEPIALEVPSSLEALASLSRMSPMLIHLFVHESRNYFGDSLRRAVPDRRRDWKMENRTPSALTDPHKAKVRNIEPTIRQRNDIILDARGQYLNLGATVEKLRLALIANDTAVIANLTKSINTPQAVMRDLEREYRPFLVSQVALSMNDRLVRLSPTVNDYYGNAMIEGIHSVQRERNGDDSANNNSNITGILTAAPIGSIRASASDSIVGAWNMSDLPPWLVIPAKTNLAHCLDPLNLGPTGDDKKKTHSLGDDLYSGRKSILVIGSSHGINLYRALCFIYLQGRDRISRQLGEQPRFNDAREASNGCGKDFLHRADFHIPSASPQFGDSGKAQPFAIVYKHHTVDMFVTLENLILNILAELGQMEITSVFPGDNETDPALLTNSGNPFPPSDGEEPLQYGHKGYVLQEMRKHLPEFAARATADNSMNSPQSTTANDTQNSSPPSSHSLVNKTFSIKKLLIRAKNGDFKQLKGLFTHIIYNVGVWESTYMNAPVQEQVESSAIAVDLLEELFAPEKITLYNPVSFQRTLHEMDSTDNAYTLSEASVPEMIPQQQMYHRPCHTPQRLGQYRDTSLCVSSEVSGRRRIRRAWANTMGNLLTREYSKQMRSDLNTSSSSPPNPFLKFHFHDSLTYRPNRAIVDIFDPSAMTTQLAHLFVDHEGHHYRDNVMLSIAERYIRDHVCPPPYVMAVRPKEKSQSQRKAQSMAHSSKVSPNVTWHFGDTPPPPRKRVNFANSPLPDEFPFPPGVNKIYIRVKASNPHAALVEMPTLIRSPSSGDGRGGGFEIRNLFPLYKLPTADVAEGVCRAFFDHPYSDMSIGYRQVKRNASFGLRLAEGEAPWWLEVDPSGYAEGLDNPPLKPKMVNVTVNVAQSINMLIESAPRSVSIGTLNMQNPFSMSPTCVSKRADRLLKKGTFQEASRGMGTVNTALDVRRAASGISSRNGIIPLTPGDPLHSRISFRMYRTPRHIIDNMYVLRTKTYSDPSGHGHGISCHIYDKGGILNGDFGSQYPLEPFPVAIEVPDSTGISGGCTVPHVEELYGRILGYTHVLVMSLLTAPSKPLKNITEGINNDFTHNNSH